VLRFGEGRVTTRNTGCALPGFFIAIKGHCWALAEVYVLLSVILVVVVVGVVVIIHPQ